MVRNDEVVAPRWALVTGASGGLGMEFARQLANRGINLILTARSADRLKLAAETIAFESRADIRTYSCDLSASGAADELDRQLTADGLFPDILINNAGFGLHGRFLDQDLDHIRAMIQLNVVALSELTHIYAKRMVARGAGRILLVGSMAAYQPVALYSAYAAAKAYVLAFGEALHVEVAPTVTVTVLSPGLMDTGFNDVAGYTIPPSLRSMVLPPSDVARIGLEALFAGRPGVIAGRLNKAMALLSRFLPRHFSARSQWDIAKRQVAHG